jgi:hypothetical protein
MYKKLVSRVARLSLPLSLESIILICSAAFKATREKKKRLERVTDGLLGGIPLALLKKNAPRSAPSPFTLFARYPTLKLGREKPFAQVKTGCLLPTIPVDGRACYP